MSSVTITSSYPDIIRKILTEADIICNGQIFHVENAQWDTGAVKSSISQKVIDFFGLKPKGSAIACSPTGEKDVGIYSVSIALCENAILNDVYVLGSEIGNDNVDLLIGMDIISLGDFTLTNKGHTEFSFTIP